jgi:hypothetical protein
MDLFTVVSARGQEIYAEQKILMSNYTNKEVEK